MCPLEPDTAGGRAQRNEAGSDNEVVPAAVFVSSVAPATADTGGGVSIESSAANRLIGEVVQSQRRPLLGPSPG